MTKTKQFGLMDDEMFAIALKHTLNIEGGYVNDPGDPGGATNCGISLRFLKSLDQDDFSFSFDVDGDGDIDAADIQGLSLDQVIDLYKKAFWDRYKCAQLPTDIAVRFFDMCVNMGPYPAILVLQRAIRAHQFIIEVDGKLGDITISAALRSVNFHFDPSPLMATIRSEHAAFYRSLIAEKPHFEKYRNGWMARAYS